MNLFRTLILFLCSAAIVGNYAYAENMVIVEPIDTDFMVLGKAEGEYLLAKGNACFSVSRLELKLHSDAKEKKEIISVRFGLAVPYEGTIFDYLAQTNQFPINQILNQKSPIVINDVNLCLKIPSRAKNEKYFLSMEIVIKHPKYGHVTTYAHNKEGYTALMPKQ